jgi:hypothetical protein
MQDFISRFAANPKLQERAAAGYSDRLGLHNGQQRDGGAAAAAIDADEMALVNKLDEAQVRASARRLSSPSERARRVAAAVLEADALATPLPPLAAGALRLAVAHLVYLGAWGSCLPASVLMAEAALLLQLQGAGLAPDGPVQLQHEYHWNRPRDLLEVGG